MGKTGTTQWVQIKGAKGQLRLVPAKEGEFKKPGPNQRFKTGINLKKLDAAADPRGGQRRGGRGGRGGSRGGLADVSEVVGVGQGDCACACTAGKVGRCPRAPPATATSGSIS